jgi:tape measure domain-containing protein
MDGRLEYSIEGEATSLNNAVKGALGNVASLGSSIAQTAAKYGLLAAGAAAAAGAASVGYGVKLAAEREQVKIAFKNIIGDAKQADAVLSQLFEYANTTPFSTDDILSAARVLAASGFAASSLRDEIAMLGNIAAATGGDLSSLAKVYGQVRGLGKLQGQDMMQFIDQGAGEIKAQLARSMGVGTDELGEMQERGEITFDKLRKAMFELAGASGKWGKTTKEMGESTVGIFMTLKDAVEEAFRTLGEPINIAIKPLLNDAMRTAAAMKPIMGDVGTAVEESITAIRSFVLGAAQGRASVTALGQELAKAFEGFGTFASDLVDGLADTMPRVGKVLLLGLRVASAQAAISLFEALVTAGIAASEAVADAIQKVMKGDMSGLENIGAYPNAIGDVLRLPQLKEDLKTELDGLSNSVFGGLAKKLGGAVEDGVKDGIETGAGNANPKPATAGAGGNPLAAGSAPGARGRDADTNGDGIVSRREQRKSDLEQARAERRANSIKGGVSQKGVGGIAEWELLQQRDARQERGGGLVPGKGRAYKAFGPGSARDALGDTWKPSSMGRNLEAQGNQAVGGRGGPQRGQAQGGGQAPAAQTQDSSQRVLLQGILAEMRRMTQHLGSLTQG